MKLTMDYLISEKLRLEGLYLKTNDLKVKEELDNIVELINDKLKELPTIK